MSLSHSARALLGLGFAVREEDETMVIEARRDSFSIAPFSFAMLLQDELQRQLQLREDELGFDGFKHIPFPLDQG